MTWNWGMLPYVVVLLLMAWRVWRLEDKAQRLRWDMDDVKQDCSENTGWRLASVPQADLLRYAREQVASLATALGYEWKRTEAKEGWEKKRVEGAPFFGCVVSTPLRPERWSWTDEPVVDRRKGDRRKPTIAKAADDPFPSPLDRVVTRKKKPRRAH